MDTLFPAERHRRPRIPPPATPSRRDRPAAARAGWMPNAPPGRGRRTRRRPRLARPRHPAGRHLVPLSRQRRPLPRGREYPRAARRPPRQAGDRAAEAAALNNLGQSTCTRAATSQAAGHLQQALALFREDGDRAGEAARLITSASSSCRGPIPAGRQHLRAGPGPAPRPGDLVGEAHTLDGLGVVDLRHGPLRAGRRPPRAGPRPVPRDRRPGQRSVRRWPTSADLDLRLGRYQQATGHLEHALALCRETGDRAAEAGRWSDLGDVQLRRATHSRPRHHRQALASPARPGDRSGEAEALNGLGEAFSPPASLATRAWRIPRPRPGQPDRRQTERAAPTTAWPAWITPPVTLGRRLVTGAKPSPSMTIWVHQKPPGSAPTWQRTDGRRRELLAAPAHGSSDP